MTIPSSLEILGLNISAWQPTIDLTAPSYTPRGMLVDDLISKKASSYSHDISVDMGFDSASITVKGNQQYADDWIEHGLGRHIEVVDDDLITVWEGFVNEYSVSSDTLSAQGGPLIEVANRVLGVYTPLDPTADPPAAGPQTETPIQDDTTSQNRYGILESIFSIGQASVDTVSGDNQAVQAAQTLLQDLKLPRTSESLNLGESAGQAQITLQCRGYSAFLDRYIFNDATTLTEDIATKIQAALAADPNGLFSTDYSGIDANAFLVAARERENKTALAVIKALVAIGDPNDARAIFGVYEDQRAYYEIVSTTTTPEYQHRIVDKRQRIETYNGGTVVRPWQVRPGKWLFLPDFLPGHGVPTADLRDDPRMVFIERVSYSAPYSLSISGQRFGTSAQLLAKMGLGGM